MNSAVSFPPSKNILERMLTSPNCSSSTEQAMGKVRSGTTPRKLARLSQSSSAEGRTRLVLARPAHVKRANLSVRTHLRRFTRLSLGFSKTLDHLKTAISLYMAFFNFVRVHQTLPVTRAMQAA